MYRTPKRLYTTKTYYRRVKIIIHTKTAINLCALSSEPASTRASLREPASTRASVRALVLIILFPPTKDEQHDLPIIERMTEWIDWLYNTPISFFLFPTVPCLYRIILEYMLYREYWATMPLDIYGDRYTMRRQSMHVFFNPPRVQHHNVRL